MWAPDICQEPLGKLLRLAGVANTDLDDGEFIAAKPPHHVASAKATG
jgi:hypothetical protein